MKHVAFFGDGERTFSLAPVQILELERKTGTAIGALFNRVRTLNFAFSDLSETIRLALIGGGTTPQEAAALVAAYVTPRPFAESFPLAVAILETAWFGEATATATEEPA